MSDKPKRDRKAYFAAYQRKRRAGLETNRLEQAHKALWAIIERVADDDSELADDLYTLASEGLKQ